MVKKVVKTVVKKMRKKVTTAITVRQVLASYLIRDHVCYKLLGDIN